MVVIPTYPSRGGLIETFHIRAQCGVRGASEVTGHLLVVETSDCNEKTAQFLTLEHVFTNCSSIETRSRTCSMKNDFLNGYREMINMTPDSPLCRGRGGGRLGRAGHNQSTSRDETRKS